MKSDKKNTRSLGALLMAARTARGMSQEQVAAAANTGRDYYGRVESDRHIPKPETLAGIRDGMKLTKAEWIEILARYLVGTGMLGDESDVAGIIDDANALRAVEREAVDEIFDKISETVKRIERPPREKILRFLEFLIKYPSAFDGVQAMMDLEAEWRVQDTKDAAPIADTTPPGPTSKTAAAAAVMERFKRAKQGGEKAVIETKRSQDAEPEDPTMAKLLRKKRAEQSARS